ncbi:thrombospondin type 3 repeat-containing protein [Photobacterium leiognathi]|uniref:thrombospondin type 3 repeat-containing protein n=1 Tax=Photobacterium leiognathi TaxID=553611 RepID=UPI002739B928|nr:thrombospondin type 3 repeat-containing protein [Photobacterium leiognathi]
MTEGQLRVIASPIAAGMQLTARISQSVDVVTSVIERLGVTLVPTSIPVNQNQTLGISIVEQPAGASLSYQWYRLSGAVGSADNWPASSEISGATSDTYSVQSADQGNYLGVIVTDTSGSRLSASAVSVGRVESPTLSDTFNIIGSLTPMPLYQDSVPQYQAQLIRNGAIDPAGSNVITAEWYLVDSPTQVGSPTTWQTLTLPLTNTSLQGEAGRYLLLSLSYSEFGQVEAKEVVISDSIIADNVPTEFANWYGGISITPDAPASIVSTPSLFAENDTQTVTEGDGVYTVIYGYASDQAPVTIFSNIKDMVAAYFTTSLMSISAIQSDGSNTQVLGPVTVPFSNGDSSNPGVLDITQPELVYAKPTLFDTGSVSLINQRSIEDEIAVLLANDSQLSVIYQWQVSSDGGNNWSDTGSAEGQFSALTTLSAGERYRLQVSLTDGSSLVLMHSDETSDVQSSAGVTIYSIAYNVPTTPIEDVIYDVVSALTASTDSVVEPASYDARTHQWSRVESDGSLTALSTDAQYTPTANEVGFKLRVTIAYRDSSGALLAETTLDTPEVGAAPTSQPLIDMLNALSATLTPNELSVGMQVSLSMADVTTLAQSGLDVAYQWQKGSLGGGWSNISDAELSSYTAQSIDVGSALQLCITLTDSALAQINTLCSNPTEIVTDNATGYTLRTIHLSLNSATDTLSLLEDSKAWLDNLLATDPLTASYQWYRLPDGGSVDSGGQALGSASSSYTDYVLTAGDDGYRHALRVTLSNNDEINSALSNVWGGASSTAPNPGGTFQDLYQDVVRIEGVSSPYGAGDTLSARLLGSNVTNNQQPDSVMYQWQRSSVAGWEDISGANNSNYVVTAQDVTEGQLRVIASPIAAGMQLTARISQSVDVVTSVIERLGVTLVPTSIPVNQNQTLGISIVEQPAGASLSYQWYRLSGAVGSADNWPASSEISGATSDTYSVQSADQGNYLGVIVTDTSGSRLSASAVSVGRVIAPSISDSLAIEGSISVKILYENSIPQYQAQLLRNGIFDNVNREDITAKWYLIDTPTQRNAPETWKALITPLSPSSLKGHAGRYLLLALSYSENDKVKAQNVVISEAIENSTQSTPEDIDGDGIANEWDNDIDGDGVPNNLDDFPEDMNHALDLDGDGKPDSLENINIASIEISSDDSYTIKNNEIVRFVPITLSNGGTLVTSHALIGNASIVDNTLLYQAPSEMPQQMYLEYEWINDKGDTMSGQLLLLASSTDPTKPRFDDVTPVDIQAKGLFTSISGLSPTARDILGNPVPVSLLDGMPRLRSGSHIVYWEAIDPSTQATQIVGQLYRVFPQVDFEQRAIAYEGGETQVTVHLSGASPNYPVTIPVVIDSEQSTSDVNDHTLNPLHTITIDSGLKGTVRFFVNDDGISEGEERLNLSFGDGVNKGVFDSLTVTLLESDPMPSIKAITVDKQGKIRSLVYPELVEQLALKAQIFKPKASDKVLIDWFIENDGEKEPLGQTFDEELLPLDFVLPVGRHHFHYQAKVLGNNSDVLNGKMTLRVMNTQLLSRTQDSDRDGALDNVEGLVDSDNDLIPDYLDAINSCELQVIDNEKVTNGGFVLQSSPGSCIQLGRLSEKAGTYSPYVENSLRSATDEKGQELLPPDIDNISIYIENDVNNFTITDVFNESVIIVLPLMKPLETGSVYRKYTERSGWFTFDENEEGSNLRYAQGELGFCPAPGSDQYQETPILGAYCLEVTLKDGGVHDDDAERNGQIDDPGYMAYPLNTLVIPSFTVASEAVNDSQTNLNKLQFNLCNYITTVDCQRLSVISSSVDYGGMITSERQEITVTLPSWVRETTIYLTIYDGNNLVTLPVHLIVTLEEQHDNNKDIAIKGGSLNLNELLMLWLCYCIVSLFFRRGKFKYYRMTFKNVR